MLSRLDATCSQIRISRLELLIVNALMRIWWLIMSHGLLMDQLIKTYHHSIGMTGHSSIQAELECQVPGTFHGIIGAHLQKD